MAKITAENAGTQAFIPLMRELLNAYHAFASFDADGQRLSGSGLTVAQANVGTCEATVRARPPCCLVLFRPLLHCCSVWEVEISHSNTPRAPLVISLARPEQVHFET